MGERYFAKVHGAFFEYSSEFAKPLIEVWPRNGAVVEAVYEALKGWSLRLQNISARQNPANVAELQVSFDVVQAGVLFAVGVGGTSASAGNPNWSQAETIMKIATAGDAAVVASAGARLAKKTVSLSMHLAPEGVAAEEVTARFVQLGPAPPKGAKAFGFSVYGDNFSWIADKSVIVPNAIFARLSYSADGDTSHERLAEVLRKGKNEFLEMLNLRVD
jgi:hypothetical protein